MIQVDLEVRSGVARFRVAARAKNIRRAVSLAGAGYSGGEVKSPEREPVFAEGAPGRAGFVGFRMPETMAG